MLNTCVVNKAEGIQFYKKGVENNSLILTLEVDSVLISEPQARIRIFVNPPNANATTSTDDKYYLGGFSSFPSSQMTYVFNFGAFLEHFTEEESRNILAGDVLLRFVAVPLRTQAMVGSFQVFVGRCSLAVSPN